MTPLNADQQVDLITQMQSMARMGTWWRDLQTGAVHWSPGMFALLDLPADYDITPESIQRFAPETEAERFWELVHQVLDSHETQFQMEYRACTYLGNDKMVRVFGRIHRDAQGKALRLFGISQDITDEITVVALREKTRALEQSEERLRVAVQTSGVAFWEWDAVTQQVFWAASGPSGGKPVVLTLEHIYSRIHPEERQQFKDGVESCMRGAAGFTSYHRQLNPNALDTWVHARGQATFDAAGNITRVSGTAVDITELMAAQRALQQSESSFRRLSETIPQIVWTTNAAGEIDYANDRWTEYTRADKGGPLGTLMLQHLHPEDAGMVRQRWMAALQNGTLYESESRLRRHDGVYRWHLNRALPLRDAQGALLRWFGTSTDIHDRKDAEERARVAQVHLRATLNNAPVVLWAVNERGVCTTVEGSALKDLPEAFRPHLGDSFLDSQHRGVGAAVRLRRALAGETFREEISSGGRVYEAHFSPMVDAQGKNAGAVVLSLDVTLRHEAERLARSEQQSKALAQARSEFLAQMSHEIRTPMNGVLGMVQLLLDTPLSAEQMRYVRTLHSSGSILLTILNDILDLSKLEAKSVTIESVPFEPATLVQQQVDLFANRAREKDLQLHLAVDPALPQRLRGDPVRLGQIILNLLSNAIKFTEQGQISVGLQQRAFDASSCTVEIVVRDTGIGMSQEGVSRLFKPFSQVHDSTQRAYGGTGLGLSIAKYLASLMGGEMAVQSTLGAGSVFSVNLQLLRCDTGDPATAQANAAPSLRNPRWLQGRRVLVAEDNAVNQLVISNMLTNLGATAVVVHNGREAVQAAAGHDFDLILMDCQMPIQDGLAATRDIRTHEEHRSDGRRVPIVALTASAFLEDQERCRNAGMDAFLAKPVEKHALERQLSLCLEKSTKP